jgi:low affinity Fe/Cu permease
VSINEQLPPQPGQNIDFGTPPPPMIPQPQERSGLAVAGFILAFVISPLGFVLSLIAIFKTGAGKAAGRGLAVAGTIIGLLGSIVWAVVIAAVFFVANSTVADPGCIEGKAAIINNSANVDAASLQKTIDQLNAAAAKAKHDDVRNAMKAMANDYSQMLTAVKTGNMPPNLMDQITKDGNKLDSLCTIGS